MRAMKENKNIAFNALYLSIGGSLALVLIKATSGYFGHSFALIADAIESTTDILASCIVYLGLRFALKPADENHPYGHGKAEPLVTFLIVLFLICSAAIIIRHSIININTPHQLPHAWTLMVLVFIIGWKETAFRLILKKAESTHSTVLKAEAWHQRSDAFSSLAAFIGISIAVVLGKGYENADDWAALVAAAVILYNSYQIFRPALAELMDEHIYDDFITEIRQKSIEVEGIIDTEKCYIRKSGTQYFVDLHAIVDGNLTVKEGHALSHQLKDYLLDNFPTVQDVLIHIEPYNSSHHGE